MGRVQQVSIPLFSGLHTDSEGRNAETPGRVSIPLFSGLHTDGNSTRTRADPRVSIPLFSGLHTDVLCAVNMTALDLSQSLCFQGCILTWKFSTKRA